MTAPATLDHINDFPGLIRYLRDELEWEIPEDAAFGDLTFSWTPSEIGLDLDEPIEITQLRPLRADQRWGVFFLNFPHGKLPVTLMRRILRGLSKRKRASANAADRAAWDKDDLIFISAVGDADDRRLSFAHFQERGNDLPTLRVIGWDKDDTVRRLSHTDQVLRSKLGWVHGEGLPLDWRDAFTERPRESVRTAKEMAEALAALARDIRDRIKLILPKEKANGDLKQLFEAVKQTLSRDLDVDKFADTYAQTIAYGLLSARINQVRERDEKHEAAQKSELGPKPELPNITADAAGEAMPTTNPFLKELFGSFLSAGGRDASGAGLDFDELGVGEVVDLLNAADMEAVLLDFDKHKVGDDPVIHFYEGFLHAYDKALKVQRGVFYTPRPVVSFIVRSVDEVLRTEFGLADGLADVTTWAEFVAAHPETTIPAGVKGDKPFVKILDPATGTGTFLVEVIELIHTTMTAKWKAAGLSEKARLEAWNDYVPQHLLPRLYGFELMMAPYAVAHMKLGLKLADTGYRFEGVDADGTPARARVFLTNALEPARDLDMELTFMSEALAHEAKAANGAKAPGGFTVVVGNPPYSAISSNLTPELRRIVDPYRYSEGARIEERGMLQFEKNIQDDYIKFIALAESTIANAGSGVVGYVTNHSYVDGPTLRGVRWNNLQTFDRLWILDLHGNTNKKERSPDGSDDENVFDIKQGVAISIFQRGAGETSTLNVGDLWGSRESKYQRLSENTISGLGMRPIKARSPMFRWIWQDEHPSDDNWLSWPSIEALFVKWSTGTETGFDDLLVAFDPNELRKQLRLFGNPCLDDEAVRRQFDAEKGHASKLVGYREELAGISSRFFGDLQLRLYDYRSALLKKNVLKTNSFSSFDNVDAKHPALIVTRQTKAEFAPFVVGGFAGHKLTSGYDRSYVMPLYQKEMSGRDAVWRSNLTAAAEALLSAYLDRNSENLDPALYYMAAVLSAPGYTGLFRDKLKRDWPRLPLPRTGALFAELVPFGAELVALHLLDPVAAPILADPAVRFVNPNGVEARLDGRKADARRNPAGRVYVNDACWFETVPASVWEHWIGGYQPAQKWLKDRSAKGGKKPTPGRVLTPEDQLHYRRMIVALGRTAELMAEIDGVIAKHGGWPEAFKGMTD